MLSALVFLFLTGWGSPLFSQNTVDRNMGSFSDQLQAESDSLNAEQNSGLNLTDSTIVGDSTILAEEDRQPQYIEREYNHKEQVITGGVIMLCIGMILVTSNNFNPKH